MSQVTDYTIANDTGANVRSDINAVLGAIQTLNSGSSDPSACLLYTSPSPRDVEESRMPSSA